MSLDCGCKPVHVVASASLATDGRRGVARLENDIEGGSREWEQHEGAARERWGCVLRRCQDDATMLSAPDLTRLPSAVKGQRGQPKVNIDCVVVLQQSCVGGLAQRNTTNKREEGLAFRMSGAILNLQNWPT